MTSSVALRAPPSPEGKAKISFPQQSRKYPKKFRPFPCGIERDHPSRKNRADIAPVPLILRKQDATPMTDLLARFSARPRPSRFPSGYGSVEKQPVHSACAICTVYLSQFLFRARSPYSCGTAQASHLFSRHEETISSMIASKAGGLAT